MNAKNDLRYPGSPTTTTTANPGHDSQDLTHGQSPQSEAEERPSFRTAIGFALWDIYSSRYPDRLVPHAEAAQIARLKVSTFTTMRSRKAGPPYIRLFGTPYYDLGELIRWIEQKMEFNHL